ncbi:MAG: ATP phosphoribosyltransferase regulatory subunit [Eubacteriales bacterium]|nr:ATP phosphoribosyltransferase regulatory subunit [Eubacteriales bacterium]
MGQWQFHTPDGVSDILPDDCYAKRQLEKQLRELFQRGGYQEIETPGIEFYDVYASGSGLAPQEGLFKFFDQQGRILCLRYDGTVPAARVAATLYRDSQLPLRFSYVNSMYRYNEFGGGRQREFAQAGVELMGSQSPAADAEVIAMAIEAAQAIGIKDLQVSIGQVNFFKGLVAEWGLAEEVAQKLPRLIDAKDMVALEELADGVGLEAKAREVLLLMPSLYGTYDVLDQLAGLVSNPLCLDALANLRAVLEQLDLYGLLPYVSLDLGQLQSLNYYTGIIFKGFTYGLGFPLFSGGRYDQLVTNFGRDLSATGFSMGLNFAMQALRRQGQNLPDRPTVDFLGYHPSRRADALARARSMRQDGWAIVCDYDNQTLEALRGRVGNSDYAKVLYLGAEGDELITLTNDTQGGKSRG